MDKKYLVVNMLVFQERIGAGEGQAALLGELHRMGIPAAELRRECFSDLKAELPAVGLAAREYGMELYYSVPLCLYENGRLMEERLEQVYAEAQAMGCHKVKMNIGENNAVTKSDINAINALCERYDISQTVENDQTPENGRVEKIKRFLEEAHTLGGKIGFTFDMGNWLCTGENPHSAALALAPYTCYIHLKDMLAGPPAKAATRLGEGCLGWEQLLRELPQNIPTALEYPCDELCREAEKLLACGTEIF